MCYNSGRIWAVPFPAEKARSLVMIGRYTLEGYHMHAEGEVEALELLQTFADMALAWTEHSKKISTPTVRETTP